MKSVTRAIAALAAGGLAAGAFGAWLLTARGPALPGPITFAVPRHARLAEVAQALAARGVIRHAWTVRVLARATGRDRDIRWGEFRLTTPLTPEEVLDRLTRAPDALHVVTIPEGTTIATISTLLERASLGSTESFRCLLNDPEFLAAHDLPPAGAEGYLFPDTYAFAIDTPQSEILGTMVRRFGTAFDTTLAGSAERLGLTPHQAVTLASLVEAEAMRADERTLVAAVFINRLRRGMPLQSDPTVLYGRTDGSRVITRDDLRRDTPHNTYVHGGLPPTPIGNPGLASLVAAVNPAPVPHLYFVARGDGSHEFTSTLEAHNAAVDRYQRHR